MVGKINYNNEYCEKCGFKDFDLEWLCIGNKKEVFRLVCRHENVCKKYWEEIEKLKTIVGGYGNE